MYCYRVKVREKKETLLQGKMMPVKVHTEDASGTLKTLETLVVVVVVVCVCVCTMRQRPIW